jgi:L-lactate utilization protein LutB
MDNAQMPSAEVISNTVASLNANNMQTYLVKTKAEALEKLKTLIPAGKDVNTGSSTTLKQIGFMDHLREEPVTYNYLGDKVRTENDESKRRELRRHSIAVEYFVSSVNAITEDGKLVAVDASGSRVGSIPFAAEKVIIVAGVNKITKDLDAAFKRIKEYVFPLENVRMQKEHGAPGSKMNKWIIIEGEFTPNRIQVILVEENLGF